MEVLASTKAGDSVRLVIEQDKYEVPQIYAYFPSPDQDAEEVRSLCHGWGVRKTKEGFIEGILTQGMVLEVPRSDWLDMLTCREELRDRENLSEIHLVPVYFRGDRLTVDAFTLSARVDRTTWKKIEPFMQEVDSAVNDTLYEGDHFVGWVVRNGSEETVQKTLGVKAENTLRIGCQR
jgi:hypothetical protein